MASVVPAVKGETGFVVPEGGLYIGQLGAAERYLVDGKRVASDKGYKLLRFYFDTVSNDDTWDTAPKGSVCAAWQPETVADDYVSVFVQADGQLRFQTPQVAPGGWVWVLVNRGA